MLKPEGRLIMAADVPHLHGLEAMLDRHNGLLDAYKIGLQLFIAEGGAAVEAIKRKGARIMLDLKLHDIPETVELAVAEATKHGVDMITMHTSAGPEAMRRAAAASRATAGDRPPPTILGVTVLTSLSADDLWRIGDFIVVGLNEVSDRLSREDREKIITQLEAEAMQRLVVKRAMLAHHCGLGGVVCSPLEARAVRAACGPDFKIVVPGIRASGTDTQDQKRVGTATKAYQDGATYIVVGRPIRDADDPPAVIDAFHAEARAVFGDAGAGR